jgi:tRNA-specific 2-thiouridylase
MLNSLDINKKPEDTRVVVAMSGGVDSSVVAAILKQQGYEVIGITLQLYDHGAAIEKKGACCAGQDIEDARRVADKIGIPYYVLDYEKKFREQVINPFTESYIEGETPIPCVACNQTVKFSDLLATAKDLGADCLATGHYIESRLIDEATRRRGLYRPIDHSRDQSYFLFATTQEQIDYLRFPLGGLPKSKTREIAREMALVVAEKSDSQDICFVPQGKYSDIIAKLRPEAAVHGEIIKLDGTKLGTHEGIFNFTIGQRRGLGIAQGDPLYVVELDSKNARVIVGSREDLATHKVILRDVNWLGDGAIEDIPETGLDIFVKVRSTRPPIAAILKLEDGSPTITLSEGEHGVANGQACVFYQDESEQTRVLGGGWITKSERSDATEAALITLSEQPFQHAAS